jgi:hypothetical protein
MRVNIFRRAEQDGNYSYLAIPEGGIIPAEATNIDWELDAQAVEVDEDTDQIAEFDIDHPIEQIAAKGYAITGVKQ